MKQEELSADWKARSENDLGVLKVKYSTKNEQIIGYISDGKRIYDNPINQSTNQPINDRKIEDVSSADTKIIFNKPFVDTYAYEDKIDKHSYGAYFAGGANSQIISESDKFYKDLSKEDNIINDNPEEDSSEESNTNNDNPDEAKN